MKNQTFPLWPDKAPGALGVRPEDVPTITVYPPTVQANGAAMLVYPGGGYEALMDYEGDAYAIWLAGQGYYGFVVNYRLTTAGYSMTPIFQDGVRALRWVRARSGELGIHPQKIGVIGSSAGGHLCALLAVNWDHGDPHAVDPVESVSSRPDLAVLCYAPTRRMGEGFGRRMFAGRAVTEEETRIYSPIDNVR
jgi:acetyl esterase/lipase